jgi:hypothetical protein
VAADVGLEHGTLETFTGLATRGPTAGVTTVFPDGWGQVWHIGRLPPGEPVPIGSIGPQRARCLERLRKSSALTALIEGEVGVNWAGGEQRA